jgi:hypothetical protein
MQQFTVAGQKVQVVEVANGARGARGLPGDEGLPGTEGQSLNVQGVWSSLIQYGPLDAVIAPATASSALTSLYVHRSGAGEAPVGDPPASQPSFWSEVGIGDLGLSIGGVWRVRQVGHGFTRIGTPVTAQNGVYTAASADVLPNVAIAVVREIIDANTITLQSDGFVPRLSPLVNLDVSPGWVEGASYWLSLTAGRVTATAPAGAMNQIVYRIIDVHDDGTADAVVVLTNDIEINPPPSPVPPASVTRIKIDDISSGFDGQTRQFAARVLGATIPWPIPTMNVQLHIDGNPQQPTVDFNLISDGGAGGLIEFAEAPEDYMTFWAVYDAAIDSQQLVGSGPDFPPTPSANTLFYLTDPPVGLYIFIVDGTSSQWVMIDGLGGS